MKRQILIVGGCGYVGGHMTDHLIEEGHDVTVYDGLVYESRYLKDAEFIRGDIRNRELLSTLLPKFDTVIWLAAIVGDGACAIDPCLTQSINEDSVKWLVDHYKGKIVYASTCSVYGKNDAILDENAALNPLSWYAKTKLAAEQYIFNKHPGSLIFRLGTLFGKGDNQSRIRLDLVVNALTRRACHGETLKVFGGEQWRPLLHVKDVARAVNFGLCNQISGLFNLSLANYTIANIAEAVSVIVYDQTKRMVKIEYNDLAFEDQRNYQVNSTKWDNRGWEPNYTLSDGIKEMIRIFEQKRLKNEDDPVYSNQGYLNEKFWRI